ncbi:hypothetical protein G6011_04097 [Alternaria panax]|uniref:DUF6594 domain-containing protein n=1 Tax=Alternaria panax TaxID=48097 RepID=A0AAD4NTK8_9PLEO|nr:hypothetical protein G6011_04097 [Alternaria panax]
MSKGRSIDEDAMEKGEAGLAGEYALPPLVFLGTPSSTSASDNQLSTQTDTNISDQPLVRTGTGAFHTFSARFIAILYQWTPSLDACRARFHQRKQYRVPIETRRINDHARGYPNLAAFLDSDDSFALYRRFGYLQSRLLLRKQEELRTLEADLQATEKNIWSQDGHALCKRKLFGPYAARHGEILDKIEETYSSYAKLLTTAQQMMAFKKPTANEYQSVGRYMNNRKALVDDEATWIQHKEDIVTLRTDREGGWLDDIIEAFLTKCRCKLVNMVFRSEETMKKTEIDGPDMLAQPPENEDLYERFYTPSRISMLANGILMFFVLALLVLPVYLLYHMVHDVGSHDAYLVCIGLLLVFTLAFSSILSLFTKAKRHEILAAASAYCAVLVVFLGNVASPVQ